MSAKAPFIVIEGTEFSGKSTQVDYVAGYMGSLGLFSSVVQTRVPQNELRALLLADSGESYEPYTKALLNTAGFVEVDEKIIKPALMSNIPVVCDRWYVTSYIIQGQAECAGTGFVTALNMIAKVAIPDLIIVLRVDDEVIEQRAKKRAEERGEVNFYDKKGPEFNRAVREGYAKLSQLDSVLFPNVVEVDGNGSVEEVKLRVQQAIAKHFNY